MEEQYQGPHTISIVQAVISEKSSMEDFTKAKQAVERNLDQDSDLSVSFAEAASILEP
jgi:hypothetical protein